MPHSSRIARVLILAGYAVCLLQIWIPDWYLTGDGPCHLYNAGILHDLWAGKNTGFYGRFFNVVGRPNPNWMSHLVLAGLQYFIKGVLAEKVLLSVYVWLFLSGFNKLLRRLDADSYYWPLVVFVFVFHYVLAKGFYNFSISVALLFWMVNGWFRVMDKLNWGRVALFILLAVLTFFTHPVPFVLGGVCCGLLVITRQLSSEKRQGALRTIAKYLGILLICLLPCLLFLVSFARGEAHEGGIVLHVAKYKLLEFTDFNCMVNLTSREVLLVRCLWYLLAGLLLFAVISRFRRGILWLQYYGLLLTMFFTFFLYLFFPDKLFGGSLFVVRAQYLWALLCVCCIGYLFPAGRWKNIAGLAFFGCFLWLSVIRMECRKVISDGVGDILSLEQYIRPGTVVLPLDFSPGGSDKEGKVIADRNWLFCHAWQYMGLDKPLIILDNYEANTGYFPLVWKDEVNPYHHLCTNGAMEGQPPYATIIAYKQQTGVAIDYILMWCYEDKWLGDQQFRLLYREIMYGYRQVARSASGKVLLYEKRQVAQSAQ